MFQPDWALGTPQTEDAYDPALEFTWNDLIDLDYEDPTPPPPQTTFTNTNTHQINVHDWLDGASAPPSPCAHCTQARLQCLVLRTAANANPNPIRACSSCVALFRECSLAAGEKRQPSEFETLAPVYGHMHGLAEEDSHGQPEREPESDRGRGGGEHTHVSSLRRGGRVLRNWFHRHHEYPYPTDEEKDALAHESGLSKRQVSNWFSNARRRHKQQYHARRYSNSSSQNNTRSGSPVPPRSGGLDFALMTMMTPMERWQSSPPDSEPVSESAIQNAIVASQLDLPTNTTTTTITTRRHEVSADDASSSRLSSSRSSLAGYSESSGSMTSAWSNQSGILCDAIHCRDYQRRRRRRRETHTAQDHLYQCTFCRYSSKKRHDWARHERSVHLSLESWLCTPDLEAVRAAISLSSSSSTQTCALCGETNITSPTHFDDVHDFGICADRPVGERTFGRKDHFWQHLQKFHRCTTFSSQDVLQRLDQLCRSQQRTQVRSRCGFCERGLQTWEQRAQHLAEHFKQGFRMSQWRGGWGVDENEVELRGVVVPWER